MKRRGMIAVVISTLLWWGWLSTPIIGVASTADSQATIRFDGQSESVSESSSSESKPGTIHVTEDEHHESESTVTVQPPTVQEPKTSVSGWLPQTSEAWWLSASIVRLGLLVILIGCQLVSYLKKRSSLL